MDSIKSDIPLLLSKKAMKKAKIKIDLENDRCVVFGKDVDLKTTTSGQYCLFASFRRQARGEKCQYRLGTSGEPRGYFSVS